MINVPGIGDDILKYTNPLLLELAKPSKDVLRIWHVALTDDLCLLELVVCILVRSNHLRFRSLLLPGLPTDTRNSKSGIPTSLILLPTATRQPHILQILFVRTELITQVGIMFQYRVINALKRL